MRTELESGVRRAAATGGQSALFWLVVAIDIGLWMIVGMDSAWYGDPKTWKPIIGYILGGSILLITLAVFVGWKLPFIANDQQALLAIAILAGLKVMNAVTHYLLARS